MARMRVIVVVVAMTAMPAGLAAQFVTLDGVPVAPAPRDPAAGLPTDVPPEEAETRLQLGSYARAFDPTEPGPTPAAAGVPRFQSTVEVTAEMPADLNQTMAVWWRHFNFEYSIYGRGYNLQGDPTKPMVNMLTLFDWAKKQIQNIRRNRHSSSSE